MKLFEQFVEQFGKYLNEEEIEEVKECWNDNCRNAIVLGIWDRKKHRAIARKNLAEWISDHPDKWEQKYNSSTVTLIDELRR